MLLALAAWAFPIHVATSQTKIQIGDQDYVSADIIIKDNAIQPIPTPEVSRIPPQRVRVPDGRNNPASQGYSQGYSGRVYTKEEVQHLIKDYSVRYGISSELPLRIAQCESGFNQSSRNRSSTASGVFQYMASTWNNTEAGRSGISVFDADANVHMAVSSIAAHGTAPWNSSRSCWQ